jgi:putative tryptophan/tyrosine transport system substrate-binding protein
MRRRDFITGLSSMAAVASPLTTLAQQDGRVRRVALLDIQDEADPVVQTRWAVLREALAKLGWIEGRNVRFEVRFSDGDLERTRAHADELVRLAPDLIAVVSGPAARVLLQRTRTIPIVFTNVGDPVAFGLLQSIARPEGNATGVTNLYQSLGGKWLELLKEAVPGIARVALIYEAGIVNDQYFGVIEAAAEALAIKAIRAPYRNDAELERAIDVLAAQRNAGLVMIPPPPSPSSRKLIYRLAVKHRLPTIYASKHLVAEGFMMGYGADAFEASRVAASYIDRILRGAKISELPVQFPTKFELVINLKTAKAIGLDIPSTLLARADEIIQ